jgi:alpha-L-fucosidase
MKFSRREILVGAGASLVPITKKKEFLEVGEPKTKSVKPTPQQLAWQEAELSMFLHFGVNTFTDREWGTGKESPQIFQPSAQDTEQWVATAKEAGFKYIILTAKHHDGFCLWQSDQTAHSVKSSSWRDGKGDVVGDFAKACHSAGLKMGLYLSPWDMNAPTYGDSPAYNRYYVAQLTELLTRYGEVAEVWLDGANGEGPNGKRQVYDWQAFYSTIRKYQPKALIAISGPDIRWVGNEDGFAHETEWSVREPDPTIHAGKTEKLWWPAECDVSIRPGWFWHKSQDTQVKPLSHLMDIYYRSVGHNSVLLLNVPPNDRGLIAKEDVARLTEFRRERERVFAHNLAHKCPVTAESEAPRHKANTLTDTNPRSFWTPSNNALQASAEVTLPKEERIGISLLQEHIREGQHVSKYQIEALTSTGWTSIVKGTTIGHKKIDRFTPIRATKLRLTIIESQAPPQLTNWQLFGGGE